MDESGTVIADESPRPGRSDRHEYS